MSCLADSACCPLLPEFSVVTFSLHTTLRLLLYDNAAPMELATPLVTDVTVFFYVS